MGTPVVERTDALERSIRTNQREVRALHLPSPPEDGNLVTQWNPASARSAFVGEIAQTLERAGVDYVFLHGYTADSRDSDVDLAICPRDRDTVDLIMRSGVFGPLLQRLDYDVPWSRYYVL